MAEEIAPMQIEASTEQIEPPHPKPRRPSAAVPAGACDTHAHVFAPRSFYPYAERRPYTPAPGTDLAAYQKTLVALGIERAVLVHSNIYGPDNRATLDALATMAGSGRGIALVTPEIDDGALRRLDACGMRGVRINLEFPGEMGLAEVEAMAPRLADLGWHLQMLVQTERLPEIASRLRALPIDMVIDHMGLPAPERGVETAGMAALLDLLERGGCWVKLSAPYYGEPDPPGYAFAAAVASRLWEARPDRMLFGTNWPHPHSSPPPDDGDLIDWLAAVTGGGANLAQVLVDNPVRLYGFAAPGPAGAHRS
jgi:2-pyrone-4,6-dicarboxylate lactonase